MKSYRINIPEKTITRDNVILLDKSELSSTGVIISHRERFAVDLENAHYCKVDTFSGCLAGTMRVPEADLDAFMKFGFILKEDVLYIISKSDALYDTVDEIASDEESFCSLSQFLLHLFERLISDDSRNLVLTEEELNDFEESVLDNDSQNTDEHILILRKRLSQLHSYYEQLIDVGETMQMNYSRDMSEGEVHGWRLFTKRAERLHDHVESLREHILQIRELYQSSIAKKQNYIINLLTVITAMFLPLTLIAGWYGMNFKVMPELAWKYGYLIVFVVSVLIVVVEIIIFRKKKIL